MEKILSYRKDIWILLLRPWSYIFILTTCFIEVLMMRIWRHYDGNVNVPCRYQDLYCRDLVMYSSWHKTTSSVFDLSRHNFFDSKISSCRWQLLPNPTDVPRPRNLLTSVLEHHSVWNFWYYFSNSSLHVFFMSFGFFPSTNFHVLLDA